MGNSVLLFGGGDFPECGQCSSPMRDAEFELQGQIFDGWHCDDCGTSAAHVGGEEMAVSHVLMKAEMVPSISAGSRMIKQGGVRVDGERINDERAALEVDRTYVIQAGKRNIKRVALDRPMRYWGGEAA